MSSVASQGLENAASTWTLRDRTSIREGVVRSLFVHEHRRARYECMIDLSAKQARFVGSGGGQGQALTLQLSGEAADPSAWKCDCPAGSVAMCLHAMLAAGALTREVEPGAADDTPDARFARGGEASQSLIGAAEKYGASIDKLDDCVRVGDAIVRVNGATLGCDCPLGTATTCLHRVVVDAWAKGIRPARPSASGSGFTPMAALVADREDDRPIGGIAVGEKLPDEDVERFEPILQRVETLGAEMICYGLQRTSAATLERIQAIITQARAEGIRENAPRHAGLGRLIRTLERLVQITGEFQQRIVTTTELDVLRELAILRNITRAIRANTGTLPLSEFAGATQQEYISVPALDIQGLGFEVWTTAAGFGGVTSYVANLRTGQILTRTAALPQEQLPGGWQESLASQAAFAGSSISILETARSRLLLSGAQVAPDSGRLSGSSKTQVAKRDAVGLDDAKLRRATLSGAADALRVAKRLGFDALGRPPTSPPVALAPIKEIGPAEWNRRTQTMHLTIVTPSATLPVSIGYRDSISMYIDNLEKMAKADATPKFIFVRVRVGENGFGVEPITAYYEGQKAGKLERKHLTFKELDVS